MPLSITQSCDYNIKGHPKLWNVCCTINQHPLISAGQTFRPDCIFTQFSDTTIDHWISWLIMLFHHVHDWSWLIMIGNHKQRAPLPVKNDSSLSQLSRLDQPWLMIIAQTCFQCSWTGCSVGQVVLLSLLAIFMGCLIGQTFYKMY